MKTIWILMLGVALAGTALAQPSGRGLVKAQLLADVSTVQPGQTFTVGVLYTIKPGWHIYWKFPGDAGAATDVKFKTPEGFEVGPLLWPTPISFQQPGNLIGYGYENSLLLMAKVKAPANLSAGAEPLISAETTWLCCEKVCVPGSDKKLAIQLGSSSAPTAANVELFQKWQQRLPIDPTDPASPLRITYEGKLEASNAGSLKVVLHWKDRPGSEVTFYPAPEPALVVENIAAEGSKFVAFNARVLKGNTLKSDSMPGLVVFTDSSGQQRAVNVNVPLRPTATE